MIKPGRNPFIFAFFDAYIMRIVRRHFREVLFSPLKMTGNRSVLLLANHFSWWDGFLFWYLNKKMLKRRFHVMVLEETLRKQRFMRHLGGFSIGRAPGHMRDSMRFAASLLEQPGNLVLIFPQGKIHSNFIQDIRFMRGVEHIVAHAGTDFHYVFASVFTEHLQYPKPSAWIALEQHPATEFSSAKELESAFHVHHASARQKQEHYQA
ncbi:MAG: lysophospholipid acyltransferase family protein [Mucilaginibacter polytrichastri]|nr:lysophospholipid acyltransferase family protein [Mucilaginibacter polytrichastri]